MGTVDRYDPANPGYSSEHPAQGSKRHPPADSAAPDLGRRLDSPGPVTSPASHLAAQLRRLRLPHVRATALAASIGTGRCFRGPTDPVDTRGGSYCIQAYPAACSVTRQRAQPREALIRLSARGRPEFVRGGTAKLTGDALAPTAHAGVLRCPGRPLTGPSIGVFRPTTTSGRYEGTTCRHNASKGSRYAMVSWMSASMSRSSDWLRSPGEGHDRRGPRHRETYDDSA
ncbi:MAG: hypothetical protein QOH72_5064, partial [Solirubrobacteraceae bacterium]|nr:hypothetical protein [Solirubrobacteraceae bacterium]